MSGKSHYFPKMLKKFLIKQLRRSLPVNIINFPLVQMQMFRKMSNKILFLSNFGFTTLNVRVMCIQLKRLGIFSPTSGSTLEFRHFFCFCGVLNISKIACRQLLILCIQKSHLGNIYSENERKYKLFFHEHFDTHFIKLIDSPISYTGYNQYLIQREGSIHFICRLLKVLSFTDYHGWGNQNYISVMDKKFNS